VPLTHNSPAVVVGQSAHVPPPLPQLSGLVPGTHVPPLQQPPLHLTTLVQLVLHLPPLQAKSAGQSVSVMQPHAPATHAPPLALPAQSVQAEADPHVVGDVPAMQVPVEPPQQKPVPQAPPSQLDVHDPPEHVGVTPLHDVQWVPSEPQLVVLAPVTQLVPSQHLPLQVRPPAQLAAQAPVFGSHASPFGQLGDDAHPESLLASPLESWPLPESGPEAWSFATSCKTSLVESSVTSAPPSPQEPTQLPCSSSEHAVRPAPVALRRSIDAR